MVINSTCILRVGISCYFIISHHSSLPQHSEGHRDFGQNLEYHKLERSQDLLLSLKAVSFLHMIQLKISNIDLEPSICNFTGFLA